MLEAKKLNSANSIIKAVIENQDLEAKKEKIAKQIAKKVKIDGFRPGKVPVKMVKKMYAEDIEQDAISEAIREVLNKGLEELGIKDMIAEPEVTKFDKKDDKIEVEIKVYTKPEIEVDNEYKECIPEVEAPEVTEEEIEDEIKKIAEAQAETKVSKKKTLKEGLIGIIDFTGYIDGKKMENGSAEAYLLEIGSNSFIEGFEEQLVGMKAGESKRIKVTFPENYSAKEIAGKDAEFDVTLQEIQEKVPAEINDEFAKKYLAREDATLDELKDMIKETIQNRKKAEIFAPKKEEILECLVKKYEIDLPDSVVEKEVEIMINNEASKMSPAKLKELQENPEKVKELKEKLLPEAKDRVKLTFIIDAIAKKEGIEVSDQELTQILYYEAIIQGQNPLDVIKYYQENNLLPVIKMNLIEEKLLNKFLEDKVKGN
jgi:trigger factor